MTTEIYSTTETNSIGNDGIYDWYLVDDNFCRAPLTNVIDVFGYRSGLRFEYPLHHVEYFYKTRGYDECVKLFGQVVADYISN